ncbi:MAG: hypothetical protein J2P49_09005 [Methylocapsa sp.]|nr:hypothetical protein [Methylocapsa sp.]
MTVERAGFIGRQPGVARSIALLEPPPEPPDLTDLDGWRRAAEEGLLDYLPLEAIFVALQDLPFETDPACATSSLRP